MRIKKSEKELFLSVIQAIDAEAEVYLFGSRTDDNLKGGDIDLLILSGKLDFNDKLLIKKRIFEKIEEQKIDILIGQNSEDPFIKSIMKNAELLQH
jgi:predicted nucleotidyltransferase